MIEHRCNLRLVRTPWSGPVPCDARATPFKCAEDYAAVAELAIPSTVPVLLGMHQHYQLIATVIERVRALLPDAPILVEVHRPTGVALPAALLQADLIMADDISNEVAYWRALGRRRVAALRFALKCELGEFGDNTVAFALFDRDAGPDPWPELIASTPFSNASVTLDAASDK